MHFVTLYIALLLYQLDHAFSMQVDPSTFVFLFTLAPCKGLDSSSKAARWSSSQGDLPVGLNSLLECKRKIVNVLFILGLCMSGSFDRFKAY